MSVVFTEENHKYESNDGDNIVWTSTTSVISKFKKPFDKDLVAEKVSKNKKSKWYGKTPDQIKDIWSKEGERAMELGNWYHNQRESDLLEFTTIERYGKEVDIIRPLTEGDKKLAPSQKLSDGVYPELLVYLKSAGISGQSDLVEVVDGYVHITDYKTNKEIKEKSYVNWEGSSQKMLEPVKHLDDCNLNHYNLQLSLYMYIILKHNRRLKAGNLVIQHVKFKKEQEDSNGYPIYARTPQGDPVIQDIIYYEMPYLKEEVANIIKHLKENNNAR